MSNKRMARFRRMGINNASPWTVTDIVIEPQPCLLCEGKKDMQSQATQTNFNPLSETCSESFRGNVFKRMFESAERCLYNINTPVKGKKRIIMENERMIEVFTILWPKSWMLTSVEDKFDSALDEEPSIPLIDLENEEENQSIENYEFVRIRKVKLK